jgi:hypothetical protein
MVEKIPHRMTLRDLLTHAEKRARDVTDVVHTQFMPKVTEFRDLARAGRKKSQYPTMHTIDNAVHRVELTLEELLKVMASVEANVSQIAERIRKERLDRI